MALTPPTAAPTSAALAPPSRGARRDRVDLDGLAFPADERDVVGRARAARRAARRGRRRRRRSGARFRREPPETAAVAGARGDADGRAALARGRPPPPAGHRRRRHRRRGPGRARGRRGARPGDGGDARGPGRHPRGAARRGPRMSAMATATLPQLKRPVPLGGRPHRGRPARRAGALHHPPRRRLQRAVRLAQPRPADRRRQRQRQREPGARGRRDRLPARELPLRQAGPRRHRAPRHRAARPGAAPHRRGRPGDRAAQPPRARLRGRLHARRSSRREGAIATLHVGWRPAAAGIVHEGIKALREVGGTGPITALIGPGARGCCYEVGEEVHAHFAGYDARRGRNLDLPAVIRAAARGRRGPRRRALHDVLVRPVLLAPPRRRHHGPPGRDRVATLTAERVRENLARVREELPDARADPRRRQVRAARGARRARRGRHRAGGGEPRPGPRGQGRGAPRVPLALHRPAPEPQGQADPPARRADPLGGLRLRAAPARAPRHARHEDPRRGEHRRRGGQGRDRARTSWATSSPAAR